MVFQFRCLAIISLFVSLLIAFNVNAFEYLQILPTKSLINTKNPQNLKKILLGKKLFYERNLSLNNNISCNDCHNLLLGGDDDQAFSIGANGKQSRRSAPGLWNIGLQTVLFWDGRAKTLEEQAIEHLTDPNILGIKDASTLEIRLQQSKQYQELFASAFKTPNSVSLENIANALASFQRELLAPNSPFDRYLGGDKQALTLAAIKGMQDFNNMGCLACHFGVNFAGPAPGPAMAMGDGFYELFPNNLGSKYDKLLNLTADKGRYHITNNPSHKYLWRVPSLRNIALTAPYFHNGSAKTLREAIEVMAKVQFGHTLSEQQITNIVAFLNSLTGEVPEIVRSK